MAGNKIRSAQANILHQSDTAPSAPSTGQLWWETDTNILWFWNGAYWLSCQLFSCNHTWNGEASGGERYIGSPELEQGIVNDIFFVDLVTSVYVASPNDANNYWTFTAKYLPTTSGAGTTLGSHNTSGNTVANFAIQKTQLDARVVLGGSTTCEIITITPAKGGATALPGVFYGTAIITFRWAHA